MMTMRQMLPVAPPFSRHVRTAIAEVDIAADIGIRHDCSCSYLCSTLRRLQAAMRYLTLLSGLLAVHGVRAAVDCKPVVSSPDGPSTLQFDLTPLAGLHEASKETKTPPTTQEARVAFSVCGDDSVPFDDKLAEEDQVRRHVGSGLLAGR